MFSYLRNFSGCIFTSGNSLLKAGLEGRGRWGVEDCVFKTGLWTHRMFFGKPRLAKKAFWDSSPVPFTCILSIGYCCCAQRFKSSSQLPGHICCQLSTLHWKVQQCQWDVSCLPLVQTASAACGLYSQWRISLVQLCYHISLGAVQTCFNSLKPIEPQNGKENKSPESYWCLAMSLAIM